MSKKALGISRLILIPVTVFCFGCQTTSLLQRKSAVDQNWGRSHESQKYSQIINHNAESSPEPVESFDGIKAQSALERDRKSACEKESSTEFGVLTIKRK